VIAQDYTFESKQYLKIFVLDVDEEKNLPTTYIKDASETDLLGRIDCLLSEIVGARKSVFDKNLTGNVEGRKYGRIRIEAEQLAEGARVGDVLVLHMIGQALAAKDGMPYHVVQHQFSRIGSGDFLPLMITYIKAGFVSARHVRQKRPFPYHQARCSRRILRRPRQD
jgi:hypothetical protein